MTRVLRPGYVGVDVACRKGKHLPIAICTWEDGRLIPQQLRELGLSPPRGEGNLAALDPTKARRFAKQAAIYVSAACDELGLTPRRIAIDAPSAPRLASLSRRAAEKAMDRAGISCFTTPSEREFQLIRKKVRRHLKRGGSQSTLPHANQIWMLVGFALFEELGNLAPCLEVFPQAIVRTIGSGQVHKSRPGAVRRQLAAASRFTRWPGPAANESSLGAIAWGPPHDQLDAYLAAWVAALDEADRIAYGEPPGDAIWVPRVPPELLRAGPLINNAPPPYTALTKTKQAGRRVAAPVAARLCPACGVYEFQRWPWGWDSHAAYTCRGLSGIEPRARKADYRSRFRGKGPVDARLDSGVRAREAK